MNPQPKPTTLTDQSRVDWVKTRPCLLSGSWPIPFDVKARFSIPSCDGPIDPHHVVPIGGAKTGGKTDDDRTVPVCRLHHDWIAARQSSPEIRTWLERVILELNWVWSASQPKPKAKRERRSSMKAALNVTHCEKCHGSHERIPLSKVTVSRSGLMFRCVRMNELVTVTK